MIASVGGIRFSSIGLGSAGVCRGKWVGRGVLLVLFFLEGQCFSGMMVLVMVYSISDVSCSFLVPLVL